MYQIVNEPYFNDTFLNQLSIVNHKDGELWSMEEEIMGRLNRGNSGKYHMWRFSSTNHPNHGEFVQKYEAYKKQKLSDEISLEIKKGIHQMEKMAKPEPKKSFSEALKFHIETTLANTTVFDDIADQIEYVNIPDNTEPTPTQFQAQELNSKVRNRQYIKEDVPLNEMPPKRIKEIIRSEFNHPEYDSVTLHLLIEHYINCKEVSPSQFQEAHKKWRRILDERNEKIRELELALKEKEAAKTIKWNLHKVVVEELESQIKQLKSNSLSGKLKEEVDKLRIANQEKDIEIRELRDQVTQQAQRWLVPNFK